MANIEKRSKSGQKGKAIRRGTASVLDRFSKYIYKCLKTGFIGALFTSYKSGVSDIVKNPKANAALPRVRDAVSSAFSNGRSSKESKELAKMFMGIRLRVYGAFLATFGVYTIIFSFFENFLLSDTRQIFSLLLGLILSVISIPLIITDESLAAALNSSFFGEGLRAVVGVRSEGFEKGLRSGRISHGFIAGVAAGVIGYLVSPYKLIFFLLFLILVWIIISKPEFGVVAISFLLPFISAKLIFALLCAVALSFAVKVIRGKRYMRFESVDASVLGVFLIILLGGIVAVSPGAYKESLFYACLISVYFLTVNLLKTKAWLDRTTVSLVFGLSLSCIFYVMGYVGDITVGGVSSVFSQLMEGTLAGSLVSGDKGIISAVSIVALPLVVSFFIRPAFKVGRGYCAVATFLLLAPVILDGSVYSAFAVGASVMLLLLIYSRNSIYLLFAGAITVPVALLLLPETAARIGASVAFGFENFKETRLALWNSILKLLSHFRFGGIGFGKASFSAVAPMLSGSSSEEVIHSGNTYLQVWMETGIFGLIIFLVFAWLLTTSAFTVFFRIDRARKNPALRTRGFRINIPDSLSKFGAEENNGNFRLSLNQYCISRRMGIAAPFCSVVGMLIYGAFDYIWYDEKVFVLFWLAAGLSAAYSGITANEIKDIEASYSLGENRAFSYETDI